MSNRPLKPIKVAISDFVTAWASNDNPNLELAERELDKIVNARLRRASYQNYPKADLEDLLDVLPEEYRGTDKIYALLTRKTPGSTKQ